MNIIKRIPMSNVGRYLYTGNNMKLFTKNAPKRNLSELNHKKQSLSAPTICHMTNYIC